LLEAPLVASVPREPPDVPELEAPLGALELVELAGSPAAVPPEAPSPYSLTHLSRSSPVMPMHWLGSALAVSLSLAAPLGDEVSLLELAGLEVLGVLGDDDVP
jgi:hypothetical protein